MPKYRKTAHLPCVEGDKPRLPSGAIPDGGACLGDGDGDHA